LSKKQLKVEEITKEINSKLLKGEEKLNEIE
jgi:hypothetical protein